MRRARGFTYLGVLMAIALLSVGLTAASEVWVTTARRQRMEQLEWVGKQYVQAIGSYYQSSPRGGTTYPRSLQDLLEDKRYPFVRRHLRQIYLNPFTGADDWELVKAPDGGIRGVRGSSGSVGDTATVTREFVYVPVF